jgi:hypothetical protein
MSGREQPASLLRKRDRGRGSTARVLSILCSAEVNDARNRSIKAKEGESVGKLLTAFTRKADEGTIGKLIVEVVILLSARSQSDGGKVLRAAAQAYGVDTDTTMVANTKKVFPARPMPTVNMWCAHTLRLTKPIATDAATIAG